LENAKKNLVFHFGVGRHASFPQKPVVNDFLPNWMIFFHLSSTWLSDLCVTKIVFSVDTQQLKKRK
jgi:hypothetical protein